MNNLEQLKWTTYDRFIDLLHSDNGAFLAEVANKTADDMLKYMSGDWRALLRDTPEKDDMDFIIKDVRYAWVCPALYSCCKKHGLEPLMGPIQARQIGSDIFAPYVVKSEVFQKAWKEVCNI